jgi:hypothetical protein
VSVRYEEVLQTCFQLSAVVASLGVVVLENLEEKNVQIHPRLQMFLDLVDIVVVAFSIMSMTWT